MGGATGPAAHVAPQFDDLARVEVLHKVVSDIYIYIYIYILYISKVVTKKGRYAYKVGINKVVTFNKTPLKYMFLSHFIIQGSYEALTVLKVIARH